MLTKTFAALAWLGGAVVLQVVVMIYGWGLEPRSWWWIVGGGFFGFLGWRAIGDRIMKDFDDGVKGKR